MPDDTSPDSRVFSAERPKMFTDAVVAIAMTLLILPLMDSVVDGAREGMPAGEWLVDSYDDVVAFLLSFGIIALFWNQHHRLFAHVERMTNALLWITIGWMATIVWMPVATAVVSEMLADPVQAVVYIGAMILASVLLMLARLYLWRHPALHSIPDGDLKRGLASDFSTIILFAAALAATVLLPNVGYYALFLLLLSGLLSRLLERAMGVPRR